MSRLVAIGMGSNLGESLTILRGACRAMNDLPQTRVRAVSRVRLTRPITGFAPPPGMATESHFFLNAVALLETSLSPVELLEKLLAIEQRFGRERPHLWNPRTLDLDILLDEAGSYCDKHLLIPHPRLASRLFFLMCLEELLPEWRHPWCDLTVSEMVKILSTSAPFFVMDLSTFRPESDGVEPSDSDTQHSATAGLDSVVLDTFLLVETMLAPRVKHSPERVLSKATDLGKSTIVDWYHFGDVPSRLREGRCVIQTRSVRWVKKQKDHPEEKDVPLPRLIIIGPRVKSLLWTPDLAEPNDGVPESSGGLPDLSLLRACAIPVVFVEPYDAVTWAVQIVAAVEASEESGRPLGELI